MWGLNFHFARMMVGEMEPLEGGLWRYGFAVLVLLIFNARNLPKWSAFQKNWVGLFLVGGVGLFGFNILFFMGMETTSGMNGALIMGLNPALTLLLSRLILKTKITGRQVAGVVIAWSGVIYLLLEGDPSRLLELTFRTGDLLVLTGVVFFALHHVLVKKYSSTELDSSQFTLLTALICALSFCFVVPFLNFTGFLGHSSSFWIGALGIGLIGTGISYLFWNKGVQRIGANKAGIFINLVPLSAGVSASFFGEELAYYHLVSTAVIIGGLLVMQGIKLKNRRHMK